MLLEVAGLSKRFGEIAALSGVSFQVRSGEVLGLIGPNGAGKTTAFNLLTGVYQADTGSVTLAGYPLDGLRPHQIANAGLARTFQNIRLFGELSVLDNVRMGAQMRERHGLATTIARSNGYVTTERRIDRASSELLEIMGLSRTTQFQAKFLSYGDQRRLEIARALATHPKVLLLDEPAAGMNPAEKAELMKLIRFIRDRFSLAILLIEHDMKLVMSICEKITVLDHGETIAVGSPDEIQKNQDVIEAYLGEPA